MSGCVLVDDGYYDDYGNQHYTVDWNVVVQEFLQSLPWVVGIVAVWFTISYFYNTSMIRLSTGAKPLTRKENMRVYNIVENLTMACGMPMPQINVINDPDLTEFQYLVDGDRWSVSIK